MEPIIKEETDQVIINDELISDFMGLNKGNGYHVYPTHGGGTCRAFQLQYHCNWNWIMEVVEKIDSLKRNGFTVCQSTATSHTFYIQYEGMMTPIPDYKAGRHRAEGESRIKNVYLAIIDFINWYNSPKQ